MRKFWGYATNGEFSVGCTGQTVYLYDKDNNEINRFKDIIYAYLPAISPNGKIFVVKSSDGRMAVYSLETFSLVKKFRFSKVNSAQDDGFCFSPDGKLFINIERQKDQIHSAISVYETSDFFLLKRIFVDDETKISHIEYDEDTNSYYIFGFSVNKKLDELQGFVAKFEDFQIKNVMPISKNEYEFYSTYLHLKRSGFAEKSYDWSYIDCNLEELKHMNHTLAKLYSYYNK